MKKFLYIIPLGLLGIFLSGCVNSSPAQVLVVPESHDFGIIDQSKGTVSTSFEVKNTGGQSLEILKLSTSCGCTTAEMDMSDLNLGESREMKVTFDPMVHPDQFGPVKRVVYLQTSDPENPEIEIDIEGNVVKGENDHDEEVADHDDDYKEYEIGPHAAKDKLESDAEVKLLDVRNQEEFNEERIPESLGASILIPHTEISKETLTQNGFEKDDEIIIVCRSGRRAKIAYDLMQELGYTNMKVLGGGLVHWVEDGFDLEKGAVTTSNETSSSSKASPKIILSKSSYIFGDVPQKGGTVSTTFEISNEGVAELKIGELTTSCGCTSASIEQATLSTGEKTTVTVTFDPDFHEEPSGTLKRTVFIPSNDPENPETEFVIEADIIESN